MTSTRAFEHHVGRSDPSRLGEPRGDYYAPLMQVLLAHNYYNLSQDHCPDFIAVPTTASAVLMKSLGLLFKDEGIGFSVLYNVKRKDDLIRYLKRQADRFSPAGSGPWTRLSFVLLLQNPYFVNFTNIPITTDPAVESFYFSNQQAHGVDPILLNPGTKVAGGQLYPTIGTQYSVAVNPRETSVVKVRDISGEVVICQPVHVPVGINPQRTSCADVAQYMEKHPGSQATFSRETIYLDFAGLPEGKYLIQQYSAGSRASLVSEITVLFTVSSGAPLCFVDLLFANPESTGSGIYPVQNLNSAPVIVSTSYELRFDRRSTVWSYFVVPMPQDKILDNLRIHTVWPSGPEAPSFELRGRKQLPNGQWAEEFVSDRNIPLQEQSEYDFQLLGSLQSESPPIVVQPIVVPLVDRLPVASNQQLNLQEPDTSPPDQGAICSPIYVYV